MKPSVGPFEYLRIAFELQWCNTWRCSFWPFSWMYETKCGRQEGGCCRCDKPDKPAQVELAAGDKKLTSVVVVDAPAALRL